MSQYDIRSTWNNLQRVVSNANFIVSMRNDIVCIINSLNFSGMEMNDYVSMKAMEGGLSPYEQVKIGYMQQKHHTSGVGIAGLVLGTVGTAAAIGAWIFSPTYASAKANGIRDLANARYDAAQNTLSQLSNLLAAERQERIAGDVTLTNTVTDSVQGSQQGSLTAQQAAELSSIQSVQQNLLNQAIMGNLSENPQKVQNYSAPQPCGCPNSCGCNG